jgi:hypothetical protein
MWLSSASMLAEVGSRLKPEWSHSCRNTSTKPSKTSLRCDIGMEIGKRCAPFPFFLYSHSLSLMQHRRRAGHTTQVGRACDAVGSQMVTPSPFTFRMTIPPCPGGSKGWNRSSRSAGYGRLRGSTRSVQISTAPLDKLTAAVGGFSFHSRTLLIKNRSFKSLSSRVATSATSIQNITAN